MDKKNPSVVDYDTYTSLGKHGYSFIDDDFLTKLLTYKIKTTSTNGTNVAFKAALNTSKEGYNIS